MGGGGAAGGRLGPTPPEDRSIDLDTLVQAYLGPIVAGLAAVAALLLLLVLLQAVRLRRLGRRLDALTRGADEGSLEAVLGGHLERVRSAVDEVDRIAVRTAIVERDLQSSLGRVGMVRFNPFEDTGGNQSFALAILDGRGDGFVVSSLHARAGTRVYAKAIAGGTSEAALSSEEAEAVRQALAKPAAGASG